MRAPGRSPTSTHSKYLRSGTSPTSRGCPLFPKRYTNTLALVGTSEAGCHHPTPFLSRTMRSLWSSFVLLSAFLNASQRSLAAHVELPHRSPTELLSSLFSRAPDNSTSILDYASGGYFINITLNGAPFSVMIDTGRCVDYIRSCPSSSPPYPPARSPYSFHKLRPLGRRVSA